MWDFQIETDKMLILVDKEDKKAVVADVAVPRDGNIRKKEHDKLDKYLGLKEKLENIWKVKVTVEHLGQ